MLLQRTPMQDKEGRKGGEAVPSSVKGRRAAGRVLFLPSRQEIIDPRKVV